MGCLVSKLAFLPPPRHSGASRIRGHRGLCWLRTEAGENLPALHIKASMFAPSWKTSTADGAELPSAEYTVLASHGNADDLATALDRHETLAYSMGCDVFAYEYAGYSISASADGGAGEGASEEGCYRSIRAAFAFLVDELGIPKDRIILFGAPRSPICVPWDVLGCVSLLHKIGAQLTPHTTYPNATVLATVP